MSAAGFGLGLVAGWVVAPFFGLVSFLRQARTFHPRGPTFHATVMTSAAAPIEFEALARGLEGPALIRFSGALWKHAEGAPDVLGCAIRLRRDDLDVAEPADDDQDLLFATVRTPWTLALAPFTTDVRDYLGNDYFAVSPFDVGIGRPVYLRLRPVHVSSGRTGPRSERLAHEASRGNALLALEVGDGPSGPWAPLLTVCIGRAADVDADALKFRPFRDGRGIRPRGFVQALRVGVYSLSQRGRPGKHGGTTKAPTLPRPRGVRPSPQGQGESSGGRRSARTVPSCQARNP